MEQAINNRKKLIENESKLLEDHRKANKEILTRHFYDMSNMMSRNEGVWLSNGWVKTLLWIFLPCFLYTVISIVYQQALSWLHGHWASIAKAQSKMHTLLNLRGIILANIHITDAKWHDSNELDEIVLEPFAFYMMEKGKAFA